MINEITKLMFIFSERLENDEYVCRPRSSKKHDLRNNKIYQN